MDSDGNRGGSTRGGREGREEKEPGHSRSRRVERVAWTEKGEAARQRKKGHEKGRGDDGKR